MDDIEFEYKEVEGIGISDEFWYALTNGYINLDKILIEGEAKTKLEDAISLVLDFENDLTSQDFWEEY